MFMGPRLSALIAYQKGACHMSYTSLEKFFGDVLHLDISRGKLAKVVRKGSAALGACYTELQVALPKRFRNYGEYYFTFLKTPGVEPTNNAMERGFRHLVIDRKVTQGTHGEPGRRWCERICTVLATCAQQDRSAFRFIYQSILAYFNNHSFPSLLPQGP
jgi:transposase